MENPRVVFELQGDKLVDFSRDMHTGEARGRLGDVFLGFFIYMGTLFF